MRSPRMVWSCALLAAGFWIGLGAAPIGRAVAAEYECEKLGIGTGKVVQDGLASGGAVVRIDLAQARPGPVASIPLPKEIQPGKHELTLKLRFEPADAYSDSFSLSIGADSATFMPTDFPSPQAPDYRLWRLAFAVGDKPPVLALVLNRTAYAEPKTSAVILDTLAVQPRSPDIGVAGVRPNKVLYMPDEEAACTVKLRNLGSAAAEREIRASEILDLGVSREIGKQTAKVAAKGDETLTFKWNVGKEQYGRELRVEVLDKQGQAVDRASEYFNVADSVWKVAMRAPHGPHMTHPDSVHCPYKTKEQWEKFVREDFPAQIHASYGNFSEWFAWAPDDAFDMTPKQETWISGQGCYQHVRSRVLDLTRVMTENGVWPITYAKSAASGPPCYEFMRKHPEFGLGRYQVQFDQQRIRDWDKQIPGQEKTIFYCWMSLVLNIVEPRIVDAAVNEILSSSEMFGWRGARYDDHYTYWGKPYDEISTRNMQRIFDLGKKRNPNFVWGFNYLVMGTQCVWPGRPKPDEPWRQKAKDAGLLADPREPCWEKMPDPYPELKIACENGGYIMNEEARGAHGGTWTNYARLLVHEARYIRKLGGHYGPIPFDPQPPSAFAAIYPDVLRAASRAHTYGDMRVDTKFRQFVTRYSSLIYGTALDPLLDPEPVLTVDATPGVWWHSFAYAWKDAGKSRVLVHLLSVPKKDKINDNKDGLVQRISNVTVGYTGPEDVAKAWELSPFMDGFIQPLACEKKTVKPTDFYLWKIVLFELKGGAK